ncbi:MAG TPA: M1 family aminopeptidase, partial [Terriglobales bacterium]|nr:M1 family aminopeptidase [Terriglobales bacterium]
MALLAVRPAGAAEKPRLQVDSYNIDAQLVPAKHQLVAHVQVKFTALEDLSVAVFELHNDLRPTRALDADGKPLSVERVTQDSTIRIALPNGLTKGNSTTLTIDYAGTLESGDNSPVQGLKLAYVGPETSYLLYAGRWFPVSGYGLNRFTATMHVTVPNFMTVIGSGATTLAGGAPSVTEEAAGEQAFQDMMKDVSVGALAYDTVPLASVGKMDPFSPEFQSLTTDKGAEILNMLRWIMGDDKFDNTMRGFAIQFAGKSATVADFQNLAQQHYGDQLTWFFTQWLNSTGAPDFKNKYTVYRLGSGKGFRIVGEITQDLDLFRMPVELKVDTDGKTEQKRIEVVGTDSPYTVDTYGRPRRIVIDPNDWVLKNSSDVKVRTAIM